VRTSLVTIVILLSSYELSLAQQNDFTKPGHYLGNPPCTQVDCSTPQRAPSVIASGDGCYTVDVGKYGIPVEHCPTDTSPPKMDDTDDDNRRYR